MNWKEQLGKYEQCFGTHSELDWNQAILLAQKIIENNPDDTEAYVRVIYALHNILVEEDYPASEHDHIAEMLKQFFDESCQKFSENPEFLFFIGKILYISEWYFGLDDDPKALEDRLAFKMQKKAFAKEPENILYEWAYVFSKDEKQRAFDLSKQLLYGNTGNLQWLKTKGFPGKYLIESIEHCHENYKEII